MVTILEDGVDSVQDICASLGLGEVPLLNAENRELNRQLQELQVVFEFRIFRFVSFPCIRSNFKGISKR